MQMVRKSETCDLHGPFKEAFKNLQCTLPHGINLIKFYVQIRS